MNPQFPTDLPFELERYELYEEPRYRFDLDRRDFFKIAGGGLVVCLALDEAFARQPGQGRGRGGGRPQEIGARLHVGETGAVTVYTGKVEVGPALRTPSRKTHTFATAGDPVKASRPPTLEALGKASVESRERVNRLRTDWVQFVMQHGEQGKLAAIAGGPGYLTWRRLRLAIQREREAVDLEVGLDGVARILADGIAPGRLDVVPSGVDPDRFAGAAPADLRREFDLPPDTHIIVNVAYLADHKGQRYLIEAAPRICGEVPAAAIFLVGEGELRAPLEELAVRLGVRARVFFTGPARLVLRPDPQADAR